MGCWTPATRRAQGEPGVDAANGRVVICEVTSAEAGLAGSVDLVVDVGSLGHGPTESSVVQIDTDVPWEEAFASTRERGLVSALKRLSSLCSGRCTSSWHSPASLGRRATGGAMKRAARLCAVITTAVAAIALTVGTPAADAAVTTLYVNRGSAACTDSGAGTATQPFCTIKRAGAVVKAGGTVLVSSGTYGGDVAVAASGTAAAPIVLTEAPGAVVSVVGGSYGFKVSSRSWVTIRGFAVRSTTGPGITVSGSNNITLEGNDVSLAGQRTSGDTNPGIKLSDTTASLVKGNVTHDNSDHGIYLSSGSQGNVISGNDTYGNARGVSRAAEGIFLKGSPGNTVTANRAHDNEDSGIGTWDGADNTVVANNVVYRNGDHGIDVLSSTGQLVVSNTVYRSVDSGIEVQGSGGATIRNNISVDNGINSPRTSGNIRIVDSGSASRTTLNRDLLYLSSGTILIDYVGTKYSTLVAFRSATGQEQNGRQGPTRCSWRRLPATSTCSPDRRPSIRPTPALRGSRPSMRTVAPAWTTRPPRTPVSGPAPSTTAVPTSSCRPPGTGRPVAGDDTATTALDTAVTVSVLANDSDPDSDPLTVTATSAPAHGSATRQRQQHRHLHPGRRLLRPGLVHVHDQ